MTSGPVTRVDRLQGMCGAFQGAVCTSRRSVHYDGIASGGSDLLDSTVSGSRRPMTSRAFRTAELTYDVVLYGGQTSYKPNSNTSGAA